MMSARSASGRRNKTTRRRRYRLRNKMLLTSQPPCASGRVRKGRNGLMRRRRNRRICQSRRPRRASKRRNRPGRVFFDRQLRPPKNRYSNGSGSNQGRRRNCQGAICSCQVISIRYEVPSRINARRRFVHNADITYVRMRRNRYYEGGRRDQYANRRRHTCLYSITTRPGARRRRRKSRCRW